MGRAGRHNEKLDLLKCIAIYAVVLIHIPLPGQAGVWANCLARFGVPLFFLSAGFFSWRRDAGVMVRRAVRCFFLLLGACLVLVLLCPILAPLGDEKLSAYLLSRLTGDNLWNLLVLQVLPLPYSWHLWFLAALLLVYVVWGLLTALAQALGRTLPYSALAAVAVVLLLCHLALGEGVSLLGGEVNSLYIRNAWLDGLPFFALGAWMGEQQSTIRRMRGDIIWAGVLLSCTLALLERTRTGYLDLQVGSILAALLLMAEAVRSPQVRVPLLRHTACRVGARLTFYIYVLHVPLYGVFKACQGVVPLFGWAMSRPWLLPWLVAAVSTMIAVLLDAGLAYISGHWNQKRGRHENH